MDAPGTASSATRMALLAHKNQLALARQGRDLLEQKRSALMKELLATADTVLERFDALQAASNAAQRAQARADATAGPEAVRAAALATPQELTLEVSATSVMGVRVPQIERRQPQDAQPARDYSPVGSSTTIDETATAFDTVVQTIIRLADSELRLKRLGEEIQSTTRRLNALDHILIPRLEAEIAHIQNVLDERERADHFRLKLMKRILERRRERAAARDEGVP
ncbi:MAG: V-type ATP synthase subunit D [Chloroflexota bacterium]